MHICLTIASLSKSSGGPSTVVQHLSEHLAQSGVAVTVVTQEAEPGQAETLPRNPQVKLLHVPAGWGGRFGGGFRKCLEPLLAAGTIDLVHDFGLWLPANHAVASVCENLKIPWVCSTSGMLAPWAVRHKAWKKKLVWWLYQHRDLSGAALIAATSEQEVQDIRRLMPGKPIALIPNGVELPEVGWPESGKRKAESGGINIKSSPVKQAKNFTGQGKQKIEIKNEFPVSAFSVSDFKNVRGQRSEEGLKKAVFLGRIHPVKGLINLVEAWSRVRPAGWQCILAGPDEGGHQAELLALLRIRKLENDFQFPGMLEDEAKWNLLKQADIFVLPSFTENFGVAAAEALACGVPVITTKGAPWAELAARQCGWWADIGVEPLATALREATSLSDTERQVMGQRGRRLVLEKYSWPKIGQDMKAVYEWVAGKGPRPGCVKF